MAVVITGEAALKRALNIQITQAKVKIRVAVKAAAVYAHGECLQITPRDTGYLMDTSFSDAVIEGDVIRGVIGYTADYAPKVHEMPADTNWKKPGAENKFLEKGVNRNVGEITRIIEAGIRI